jgi:hypothetical protein
MRILFVVAALVLTACGQPQADKKILCLYGDSTTKYNPYTELSGLGMPVVNKGVGSSKASDLIKGANEYYGVAWGEEVNNDCNIAVINFGLNDASYDKFEPSVFVQQLQAMRTLAEAKGKVVVIETPNPMSGPAEGLVAAYAAEVRNMGGLIVDNHALFGGVTRKSGWWITHIQRHTDIRRKR